MIFELVSKGQKEPIDGFCRKLERKRYGTFN